MSPFNQRKASNIWPIPAPALASALSFFSAASVIQPRHVIASAKGASRNQNSSSNAFQHRVGRVFCWWEGRRFFGGGVPVVGAENGERTNGLSHNWLLKTTLPGFTGTSYLQSSKDIDLLLQTDVFTTGPKAEYLVNFTAPATYTAWLRGYAPNAAGDSAYLQLTNSFNSINSQLIELTGFAPGEWGWAKTTLSGDDAALSIAGSGVYTAKGHNLNLFWTRIERIKRIKNKNPSNPPDPRPNVFQA